MGHFDPIIITSTKFAIQRFLEWEKLYQSSFHFLDVSRTILQSQWIITDNRRAAENFVVIVASAVDLPFPPVIIPYGKNASDKFGIKFWLAADVDSKYVFNGFPNLGKDEERPENLSLSKYVVLHLIEPFENKGRSKSVPNVKNEH
ncbi:piggyBac transposable element-derived protein 4 [Trichonephila clavipes]|nr:piggyBac transposable element-derived protein 4 [Trichonephila clavipes]